MSTDPSPWAEPVNPWDEDLGETTEENVKRSEQESLDQERQEFWADRNWQTFANRLTKSGTLIR